VLFSARLYSSEPPSGCSSVTFTVTVAVLELCGPSGVHSQTVAPTEPLPDRIADSGGIEQP